MALTSIIWSLIILKKALLLTSANIWWISSFDLSALLNINVEDLNGFEWQVADQSEGRIK